MPAWLLKNTSHAIFQLIDWLPLLLETTGKRCWDLLPNSIKNSASLKEFKTKIKGNPNSQDILNWIIQILHYYYRKQHKNIENSQIIKQNLVIALPFSLFTVACTSFIFLVAEFFQFLNTVLCKITQNFKSNNWSFVKYIVLFFGLKMVFSKLSLANITSCINSHVYSNFNLCYFMSSTKYRT